MKYLLLLVLIACVGWWLMRSRHRRPSGSASAPDKPADAATDDQVMVRCAHCQMHLPRAEAIVSANHHYCCADHRARGPARPD